MLLPLDYRNVTHVHDADIFPCYKLLTHVYLRVNKTYRVTPTDVPTGNGSDASLIRKPPMVLDMPTWIE